MKKVKIMLVGLFTSMFFISNVSAAVPANSFNNISSNVVNGSNNNMGYTISDKFVCYACGNYTTKVDVTNWFAVDYTSSGIGIYFKNGDNWETGSFAGSNSNSNFTPQEYPMSAFFVAATTGDQPKILDESMAQNIKDYLLEYSSNSLTNNSETDLNGATITVTAQPLENKNLIKLIYNIKNGSTAQKINIATFNDVFLGTPVDDDNLSNICQDNASISAITNLSNITNGFNAKTSEKFMSVILEENTGLISNGGGTFDYWVGNLSTIEDNDYVYPAALVSNMFNTHSNDYAKAYADSSFSYSWSKDMAANEETTFSTLIGLGNNNPVTINIDENTISPNYDKDNKTFSLTENDANIQIGGTIKDECGMGTCTYTINGSDPIPCDENVYYTSGDSFTTNYNTTIDVKSLKTTGNEYTVTANSVACGTATATHTFNLSGDVAENPQTGINNNYIILGLILVGGVGIFIYSKKHNKFPQV